MHSNDENFQFRSDLPNLKSIDLTCLDCIGGKGTMLTC